MIARQIEALRWAISSLENVRSVYPPGAEFWADDRRQKLDNLRALLDALDAGPRSEDGLNEERLERAMRWAGIRAEPDFATLTEAAHQLAGDYRFLTLEEADRDHRGAQP